MCRPLLFLDVDGVISLFGFDAGRPPPGRYLLIDGQPHFLSDAASGLIAELAPNYELVWCTGWEDRADMYLPTELGLPRGLAHLRFDGDSWATEVSGDGPRHWKLAAIDAFAGNDRPLAWIDDGHDHSCRAWATTRPGPTLLVGTEPALGITPAHVRTLLAWAHDLA